MPTKKPNIKTREPPPPVSLTGLGVSGKTKTAKPPAPKGKPAHLPRGACDSFPSHKPGECNDTAPLPAGQ